MALDDEAACYREWAPMTRLLSCIPTRIHRNIMGYDLSLTCVAGHRNFLALGTNAGLVYWYNRQSGHLSRLWFTDRSTPVTRVSLVETVEFMLASGNLSGGISIFQLPKKDAADLRMPSGASCPQSGELFSILGLHQSSISCLAWAVNGMKLFSGDTSGKVCLTEIDFMSRTTSSVLLFQEEGSIVQMSYVKPYLLVCSVKRACIYDTRTSGPPYQVGSTPRKVEGHFGGLLLSSDKAPAALKALVCRPKRTLHLAEASTGQVKTTILLRQLTQRSHSEVTLLNPSILHECDGPDSDFWRIHKLQQGLFVLQSSSQFHLVEPFRPSVLASCNSLRHIYDLSVADREIFVLEGPRSMVRIAPFRDGYEFRHDVVAEGEVMLSPLGDEHPEGGPGLDSVLYNLDLLTQKIPTLISEATSLAGADRGKTTGVRTILGDRFGWLPWMRHHQRRADSASSVEEASEALLDQELTGVVEHSQQDSDTDLVEHRLPDAPVAVKVMERAVPVVSEKDEETDDILGDEKSDFDYVLPGKIRLELRSGPDAAAVQDDVDEGEEKEEDVAQPSSEDKEAMLFKVLNLDRFLGIKRAPISQPAKVSETGTSTAPQWRTIDHGWNVADLPGEASHGLVWSHNAAYFAGAQSGQVFECSSQFWPPNKAGLTWTRADYLADKVVRSADGQYIWRLWKGRAWFCRALPNQTAAKWIVQREGVKDLALTASHALLLDANGSVSVRTVNADPDAEALLLDSLVDVQHIASTHRFVVALTKLGIYASPATRPFTSTSFKRWPDSPPDLESLALFGPTAGQHVWICVRDTLGHHYFSVCHVKVHDDDDQWDLDGVCWSEIMAMPGGHVSFGPDGQLCVTEDSLLRVQASSLRLLERQTVAQLPVWPSSPVDHAVLVAVTTDQTGERVTDLLVSDTTHGAVRSWRCDADRWQAVALPLSDQERVVGMAAVPSHLALLTSSGQIFMTAADPFLKSWKSSWHNDQALMVSLAISRRALWAIDSVGSVWTKERQPEDADWMMLDGPDGAQKIFCSETGDNVWLVDQHHRVHRRLTDQQTDGWIQVPEVQALHLAVSGQCTWAQGPEVSEIWLYENGASTRMACSSPVLSICGHEGGKSSVFLLDQDWRLHRWRLTSFHLQQQQQH